MGSSDSDLLAAIVDAIQDKKGIDIVDLKLSKLENAITDHFVICHGNSTTQVEAIADSVEEKVKEVLKMKAWHKEGHKNAQWILLDYASIMVHIFQKEFRDFYSLEELWADGEAKYYENV